MTDDEIKAAVEARIAAEEAAGIPRTITDPRILAGLARIIDDADVRILPRARGRK